MARKIFLLETTLRDGSYTIDFSFTIEQTRIIASALAKAGFPYIELGHGIGMNASQKIKPAAASDEEYLKVAQQTLGSATWGMFFIPGIATMEHLDLAAKHGMPLVRIGTNVTEYKMAEPFVRRAKELGMKVSFNLMKSYVVPFDEFIRIAKSVESYGSDVVVLVDSAGSMLPEDVATYISAMRKALGCQIGFHGHNNLGVANANTLTAVENGADILDVSLRGMGRSAGNAQTETMLLLLKRRGYETGVDYKEAMRIGKEHIAPLVRESRGAEPIDAVCGYAGFHSSFLPEAIAASKKNSVDLLDLIIAISKVSREHVNEEIIRKALEGMKRP